MSTDKKPRERGRRGAGTIYEMRPGKWCAQLSYVDSTGKRTRKKYFGATATEAQAQLKAALAAQQQGILPTSGKQTVSQYLTDWLQNDVQRSVRPRTYQSYSLLVRLYIAPRLGRNQLKELTPQAIRAFLVYLSEQTVKRSGKPMSARTVHYTFSVLRIALNRAVKLNLITRNPCSVLETPRNVRPEPKFLTAEQARTFLTATANDRLSALYTLAILTGLRCGELLGLTWDCVDLDSATLTVRHALQRIEGRLQLVEPKSKSSFRTVALPQVVVSALIRHRDRQVFERSAADVWEDHNLVFPSTVGGFYDAGNMVKLFHKALVAAKLPKTNFHSLRHTCASLALSQGTHMKLVQDLLGHSDFYLTMNTYSHVVPELKRDVADRMDLMFPASGE